MRAIIHDGFKLDIGRSGRKNVAARGQDFRCLFHGDGEVSRHGCKGRKKEIAKVVSFKITGAGKTKLKKFGDQVFVFRERNQAVPDIARRKHAQFTPQPATGTAIVTYGDQRSKVRDKWAIWRDFPRMDGVLLKTFKKSGQACAAADGDDTNSPG